jgi:hypothetical protein
MAKELIIIEAAEGGRAKPRFQSQVTRLQTISVGAERRDRGGADRKVDQLPNDLVFILIMGVPSIKLLPQAGVDFGCAPVPPSAVGTRATTPRLR